MQCHVSNEIAFVTERASAQTVRTFVILFLGLRRHVVGIVVEIYVALEQLFLSVNEWRVSLRIGGFIGQSQEFT